MADETQNAPVASAETATQTQPTKLYVYYYSNPDGASKDERCHAIYTDVPFDVVPWRMHKEAPAEGMVDPVWDDKLNSGLGAWKENSGTAQGQILAEAQAKIRELDEKSEQLDKANDKVDQAVKTMQQVQAQSSQQNVALMKSFTQQTQNTNKMLATMQQTLAMVVKSTQKDATPEAPKADAPTDQPQATTDTKQENGGN
ncbi:hypothetical protein KDZ21_03470 [Lactobacillus crispatus]|uniref:hypothetical protein n=1 Tax=Lactobacillus crispatus TaxID=47770 RepID=UPI001C4E1EFE|nr:hypothetical protein [Lactobacillus crispatus]MBW0437293.1 hypothetical protein [Lactobacillus crispatus]MBW0443660.1 hypothetical protein [Lactobacillus crispatus]MBW0455890.1 hypothetical protein [Lactobacillus crispatus]